MVILVASHCSIFLIYLGEVTWKLQLQDKSLRELAAEALSFLVKYYPQYFASAVMEKLIPCTLSSDLCMRHGATLATGELVLALHQCNYAIPSGLILSSRILIMLLPVVNGSETGLFYQNQKTKKEKEAIAIEFCLLYIC